MPTTTKQFKFTSTALIAGVLVAGIALGAGPEIQHDPVPVAGRGQAISILAQIKPGDASIKTATLYYSPSRDASPIKQPMTSSGGSVYVGTIPNTHLATAPGVWYYIEAVDQNDEWAETSWSQIQIRDAIGESGTAPQVIHHVPSQSSAPVTTVGTVGGSRPPAEEGGMSTGMMIGGGVLAAGAAVAIIAASDSGGGGGNSTPADDTGDSGSDTTGGDTNEILDCVVEDAIGTWTGTTEAPGFVIRSDGSADFFATIDGVPDTGSWGLVDCILTLIPNSTTNNVYRGSGEISDDRTAVTINGFSYTKL